MTGHMLIQNASLVLPDGVTRETFELLMVQSLLLRLAEV